MRKQLLVLGLATTTLLGSVAYAAPVVKKSVPAAKIENVVEVKEEKKLEVKEFLVYDLVEGIDVKMPQITGMKNSKLEKEINQELKEKALVRINEYMENEYYKDKKSELIIGYEVKSMGDIVSIKIDYYETDESSANGMMDREFINIDVKSNKVLTLKDLVKDEKKINEQIKKEIAKNEELYFNGEDGIDGFTGISKDQKFYINKDGKLVIFFDLYEIAPRSTGNPEFIVNR